jgi:hypothetical protein
MDITKVIIENWPKANYFVTWVPIVVALIALLVSLRSASFAKKAFVKAHRPYVWAISYAVPDSENKTLIPVPSRIGYRVKNAPAKIISSNIEINLDKQQLFSDLQENFVRFPDDKSEWSFGFSKEKFEEIIKQSGKDKSKLLRVIALKYSSLDGGKIYSYELRQSFIPVDNQWRDIDSKAD